MLKKTAKPAEKAAASKATAAKAAASKAPTKPVAKPAAKPVAASKPVAAAKPVKAAPVQARVEEPKKVLTQRQGFKTNEFVVYPAHGVGQILAIEEQEIAGAKLELFVINFMSGLYADITGPGSETAAKMAVEDFGGEVLGRKIEIIAADHLNKADLAANIARNMLDNQGVEAIIDVAASATALAAAEVAKERNKIIMFSGPGSIRLSNEACGPYTVHYAYDTYALAHVTGLAAVKHGLDTWFFITADYAFGHDLEKDTTDVILKSGGKVLGSVRHPINTSDFSSFLLQAQASKAKVIGLANAGGDTINAIKQAAEFGITKGGQKISPLLAFVTDIDSVGLQTAQGLVLAQAFYWDLNDDTRAFSKRFMARVKRVPTSAQAGIYSSVLHYLQAVKAAGTTDAAAVMKIMVGLGGVTTELFKDVVYRPAPVGDAEAAAMLQELKAWPLLNGFRGAALADVPALANLIVQVSQLATQLRGDVSDIEINPVLVHPQGQGVTVVDALVVPVSRNNPTG